MKTRARQGRRWLRGLGSRLMLFLAIMGPGIITSNVDNDAGGIATYSLAGAHYGYSLLWALPLAGVALFVIQEMCARMGAVTGKGLSDLIREQLGVRTTFWVMLAMLLNNFGNTLAEFSGLAAGAEVFGIPRWLSVPVGAIIAWAIPVVGTYRAVEKVFLVASAFYISYVISGIIAAPPWGEVVTRLVTPELRLEPDFLVMLVGIVGTTIAPWQMFYLQASVVEKGLSARDCPYTRLDVLAGAVSAMVVVFFIVVACGATIFAAGARVETAADAAVALRPLAGPYASALFAFGLINASLFSASVLPLSTAYYTSEAFGFEGGVGRPWRQAPFFWSLYTGTIALAAALVMLPQAPLLQIMFLSQVVNGIVLPVILLIILRLANDKRLLGRYVNGRIFNSVAWLIAVVIIGLNLVMMGAQIRGPLRGG